MDGRRPSPGCRCWEVPHPTWPKSWVGQGFIYLFGPTMYHLKLLGWCMVSYNRVPGEGTNGGLLEDNMLVDDFILKFWGMKHMYLARRRFSRWLISLSMEPLMAGGRGILHLCLLEGLHNSHERGGLTYKGLGASASTQKKPIRAIRPIWRSPHLINPSSPPPFLRRNGRNPLSLSLKKSSNQWKLSDHLNGFNLL